eukprot:2927025-Prymnesium_polylepis.1
MALSHQQRDRVDALVSARHRPELLAVQIDSPAALGELASNLRFALHCECTGGRVFNIVRTALPRGAAVRHGAAVH